jgi:hypothetical protein
MYLRGFDIRAYPAGTISLSLFQDKHEQTRCNHEYAVFYECTVAV